MKLEELTKAQVILLTLFVSFVTSIATGIVTVTLMDQAPPGITRTINRIVERTVETVVPGKPVIKEVSVIITEEDLIVKAIEDSQGTIVKVGDGAGFFVDGKNGLVVTATALVLPEPAQYAVKGTSDDLVVIGWTATSTKVLKLAEADPKVGQKVIAVTYLPEVLTGIVSSIFQADASSTPVLHTDIRTSVLGSPLLDLQGKLIGVYLSGGKALPVSVVKNILDNLNKKQ